MGRHSAGEQSDTTNPCPRTLAGWECTPAFSDKTVEGNVLRAPAFLRKYFILEWSDQNNPPTPADVDIMNSALTALGVPSFDEDGLVVAPQGSHGISSTRSALDATLFQTHIGGLSPLPAGKAPLDSPFIALADSAPPTTADGVIRLPRWSTPKSSRRSWGYCLSNAVLSGIQPPYKATSNTYLVLPQIDDEHVDMAKGGFYGPPANLAQAIYNAVTDWKLNFKKESPYHHHSLLINLSVAWTRPERICYRINLRPTRRPRRGSSTTRPGTRPATALCSSPPPVTRRWTRSRRTRCARRPGGCQRRPPPSVKRWRGPATRPSAAPGEDLQQGQRRSLSSPRLFCVRR